VKHALLSFLLLAAPLVSRASDDSAVLDELNLARAHPQQYAEIVDACVRDLPGADPRCVAETEAFLRRQRPVEPLQSAYGLMMSAREQVDEQGPTGEIGHDGPGGSTPWSRMSKWGQWVGRAGGGENISYGYSDARMIVVQLIVDQGVPGRGHRRNIFSRDFKVAGAACGPHAQFGAMCVIDFAYFFADKSAKIAMADPWRGVGE
jgi:hypothetical protein